MKLIIAGGRDFTHFEGALVRFNHIYRDKGITEIVSGTARGADRVGEGIAREIGIPITRFPADWDEYGKSAGYIRNSEMADYADALLVFWDGKSRGTKHMIDLATKKGLEVKVINYCKPTLLVGRVNSDLEDFVNIRIDRTSPLGNPFIMSEESERDCVCDKYEEYFQNKVKEVGDFRDEVIRLYRLVKAGRKVNLQCWCSPKRCHGDTIKKFILKNLEGQCIIQS